MRRLARFIDLPVAASTFGGVLGAGGGDLLATLAGGGTAGALSTAALALGLYGAAALALAGALGWATAVLASVLPGGPAALRRDPPLDARVAVGLLAGTAGTGMLAIVLA